jgi:hypothetical protein
LVAGEGYYTAGRIYVSTNSGATWSPTFAPQANWNAVACSGDFTRLMAAANNMLMVSTNSGLTWTNANVPAGNYYSVASSTNGFVLAAAAFGGSIFVSADAGLTWTNGNAPSTVWTSVWASADGTRLGAVIDGGTIYTSQLQLRLLLSAVLSGGNLLISWPVSPIAFGLQSKPNITTPMWSDVTLATTTTNNQNQVLFPLTNSSAIFRLKSL